LPTKVAVITGSSRGIGRSTAEAFCSLGYAVVLNNNKRSAELRSSVRSLSRMGFQVMGLRFDVDHYAEARRALSRVLDNYGRIDVLVNNAGIVRDGTLQKMDTHTWRSVLQTNLYGPFNCMRSVIPAMKKQGGGAIINISSVVGLRGNFGQANYASSKAGLIGLTLSAAKELARFGIRVNAVAPGFIKTKMVDSIPPERAQNIVRKIPMGRLGKPDEIAHAITFLSTAEYVTGHVLIVDGGYCL